MIRSTLVILTLILASCSGSPVEDAYCRATSSSSPTLGLAVRDVYVYGTLEHGTLIVNTSCVQPLFTFYSFQEAMSRAKEADDRVRNFNKIVYNSPARASGLFKIQGVLNVYPESRLVELYDVSASSEVDVTDARRVIDLIGEGKK